MRLNLKMRFSRRPGGNHLPPRPPKLLVKPAIEQAELPNLWKPSLLVAAEAIPLLGSGKLDLKGLKKLAEAMENN